MLKKYNKDLLERLINHTMRHGKKGAAIGLLTKSLFLLRQNLTRQEGVSRYLNLRRVEKRPHFLCTLLNPGTPNQQSPFALDMREPYVPKTFKIEKGDSLTLTFSVVSSSPLPVRSFDSQATGMVADTRLPNSTLNKFTHRERLYQSVVGKDKIGNISSNLVSRNKMLSEPIERKTSLALMSVQNVSKDNQTQTRVRSRDSISSIKVFVKDAISHIKPSLETRKKKIAGITRHVPAIVSPSRGEGLAIRWVLAAAKEKQRKGGKELAKCLSDELLDAYLKRGEARQRRDLLHKLAESNRSYVRYRWW